MAEAFQQLLLEQKIKFRPTPPRSPHLNGKVERSQQTDRIEFWGGADLSLAREQLAEQLQEWQTFYNQERGHSGLGRQTPHQKLEETRHTIPSVVLIHQGFDPSRELRRTNSRSTWIRVESRASP